MQRATMERLRNIYNSLPVKGKSTALKQHYVYNGVHVNVYVDFWEPKCPVLQMVLILQREEAQTIYYLQSVSIFENGAHKKYLEEANLEILERLLDEEKSLKTFYADMDVRLLENEVFPVNIEKQEIVVRTREYQGNQTQIYPYIWRLRRDNMSQDHFEKLRDVLSFSEKVLSAIREQGYTVITTPDSMKRVSLQVLLEGKVKIM